MGRKFIRKRNRVITFHENTKYSIRSHDHKMTYCIIQSLITWNILNVCEANFFLMVSIGWRILRKKQAIKSSPQKFQSGIWTWNFIVKIMITHPLTTRNNYTIQRKIFLLMFWLKWKVCKNPTINAGPKYFTLHILS